MGGVHFWQNYGMNGLANWSSLGAVTLHSNFQSKFDHLEFIFKVQTWWIFVVHYEICAVWVGLVYTLYKQVFRIQTYILQSSLRHSEPQKLKMLRWMHAIVTQALARKISSSFLDSNRTAVLLGDWLTNIYWNHCKSSSEHISSTYFCFNIREFQMCNIEGKRESLRHIIQATHTLSSTSCAISLKIIC